MALAVLQMPHDDVLQITDITDIDDLVDECDHDALVRSTKNKPAADNNKPVDSHDALPKTLPYWNSNDLKAELGITATDNLMAVMDAMQANVLRLSAELAAARAEADQAKAGWVPWPLKRVHAALRAEAETLTAEVARAENAEAAAEARAAEAAVARIKAEQAAKAAADERALQLEHELEALHCQLTFELFADPVCTSDGHTYEREAIEEAWRVGRELADERMQRYLSGGAGIDGDECGECCESAPEPFAYRSPNTGAVVTDALVPNHLIVRQIEALVDAGGIATEAAAEWRMRRETALLRQRERLQRPASAPASLQSTTETEARRGSLMHAAAAAGRSLRRSASFGKRTVAFPLQAVSASVSASAKSARQWAEQRALEGEERRRHRANEAASRKALSRMRKCPKCKVPLEKNGGCNHFTCRACQHQFCWECNKSWEGSGCGNSRCSTRRR